MSIRFEFSKKPQLLAQYYKIREACFRKELGLESFDGSEEEDDRAGHILIAMDVDRCIGGARFSGSPASNPTRLPMEGDDFVLEKIFPELAQQSYGQWTRLCLLPEYRTTEMLRDQCRAMVRGSVELNYSYGFNVAGLARARLYKRLHTVLGYDYKIYDQIGIPAEQGFTHLPHLLSIAFLQPEARALKCPDGSTLTQCAA